MTDIGIPWLLCRAAAIAVGVAAAAVAAAALGSEGHHFFFALTHTRGRLSHRVSASLSSDDYFLNL